MFRVAHFSTARPLRGIEKRLGRRRRFGGQTARISNYGPCWPASLASGRVGSRNVHMYTLSALGGQAENVCQSVAMLRARVAVERITKTRKNENAKGS
jgi:hypothetical protein